MIYVTFLIRKRIILCFTVTYPDNLSTDYDNGQQMVHVPFISLSLLTVLCCLPAPVPCRETVLVLCHPVCSLLLPPADLPVGCRCISPSDTWPEAELKGETLKSALGLPWTAPATGSKWRRMTVNKRIWEQFNYSLKCGCHTIPSKQPIIGNFVCKVIEWNNFFSNPIPSKTQTAINDIHTIPTLCAKAL